MSNSNTEENSVRYTEHWNVPRPATLAKPTWWPAALAFGVTLTAWGLIVLLILPLGIAIVIVSLVGWIGDICRECKAR